MIINNNIAALNTHRQMGQVSGNASNSMEKLSSGMRINRGADDAAGLSISEKMRGQIRGLEQASKNSQDAVSVIQTADGALNESHAILQRMRELTVQAANDTNSDDERTAIQGELTELTSTLTDISTNTQFNGQKLLNASAGSAADGVMTIQSGANSGETLTLDLSKADLATTLTTLATGMVGVDTAANAASSLTAIDAAIQSVSDSRAYTGAVQNRLDYTINNLNASAENTQAAESRIRDVDMAKEMMNLTKNNILTQASQAMLSQANQAPQAVLQLLR
ncbi:flagellin N-terminal helical domain-containing protein [Planomicrobium okeanokoites]|uniref:Flagellin n=1 Tax=Planomicrobium okeanokoites TaxID=244 RepID=A0ABV7KJE5_PLAOK|nr:flagellin [Planomicrobium okeanokoites]TAA69069.1 flagellin [Planomicrobium okeanokoites]